MLMLNQLSFSYQMFTIFDNAQMTAYPGQLTIIKGESGSGKSTLLDIISLKHGVDFNIFLDNQKIDNKEKYLNQLYYLGQNPVLCADLTIENQWRILKKMYHDIDIDDYVEKLNLQSVKKFYPMQLSTGEKSRCLFINAFIIQPYILLMDEPTAALNEEYKQVLLEMVNELKKDSIVIMSTHDQTLIDGADTLYEINHCQINEVYHHHVDKKDYSDKLYKIKKVRWFKEFLQMKKHHFFKNMLSMIVICFSIVFCCFSFHMDGGFLSYYENQINNTQTNTILMFKALDVRKPNFNYDFSDATYFPINDKEYKRICQIKHIKDLQPEIIMYSNDDIPSFEIYNSHNERIYQYNDTLEKEEEEKKSYLSTLFIENIEEEEIQKYISKKFDVQKNGIYLNSLLLSRCDLNENDIQNCTVHIDIEVPLYNVSGDYSIIVDKEDEDNDWIPANGYKTKKIHMELPINGIIVTGYESSLKVQPQNALYLPRDILMSHINKYKVNNHFEKYFKEVEQELIEVKDIDKATVVMKYSPWQPNAYHIIVDSSENVEKVAKELKKLGYSVDWTYNAMRNYRDSLQKTKNMVEITSFIFVGIVIVIIGIRFFIKNKKEYEFNQWLYHIGYVQKREILLIKLKKYLLDFLIIFLLSPIIQLIFNDMMLKISHIPSFVDLTSFIVTFLISITTTTLIPMIWEVTRHVET